MSLVLRPATAADVPALRDLLVTTWHTTYDPIYGAEKVTEITGRWHSEGKLADQVRQAERHPHRECLLVAEGDGQLIGTASAHRLGEEIVELGRLYIPRIASAAGLAGA